jgi:hypothetical protein
MRSISLVLLATAAFGQTYTTSTFAGGSLPENFPGASVSLNQIGGLAVDAAGNVFLSLPRYEAVMRLDATTGILTRVGLALDPAGNLYIADTNNRRICKVSNGIITTVAGNGVDGAGSPRSHTMAPLVTQATTRLNFGVPCGVAPGTTVSIRLTNLDRRTVPSRLVWQ